MVKWPEAAEPMPRAKLLEAVKGAEGLCVLLTDKIDAELLDAAGKFTLCEIRLIVFELSNAPQVPS